ncbi:hypothetical protein S83_031596 [Arachis hypogaea]|nr:uncharacterized protein DS421_10g296320 [Arachis hypogaea]
MNHKAFSLVNLDWVFPCKRFLSTRFEGQFESITWVYDLYASSKPALRRLKMPRVSNTDLLAAFHDDVTMRSPPKT